MPGDDDLDFLLRPWLRGKCLYESLKDGTLDLYDVGLMNDALDVADENERREIAARRGR